MSKAEEVKTLKAKLKRLKAERDTVAFQLAELAAEKQLPVGSPPRMWRHKCGASGLMEVRASGFSCSQCGSEGPEGAARFIEWMLEHFSREAMLAALAAAPRANA